MTEERHEQPTNVRPGAATEAGARSLDALTQNGRSLLDLAQEHRSQLVSDLAVTTDALQDVYDLYELVRLRSDVLANQASELLLRQHAVERELTAIKSESALGLFLRKLFNRMPGPDSRPLFSLSGLRSIVGRKALRATASRVFLATGRRTLGAYRAFRAPHVRLPSVAIVVPVCDGARDARETIRSIVAQAYPGVRYVEEDAALGVYDSIRRGVAEVDGEIVGFVSAGDLLEAGALERVGRFFAEHPHVDAIYHEEIVQRSGWRLPGDAQPRSVGAGELRAGHRLPRSGVFFRRRAYEAIRERFAQPAGTDESVLWTQMAARTRFVLHAGHATTNAPLSENGVPKPQGHRAHDRLFFPSDTTQRTLAADVLIATAAPPARCPITGSLPERLLFSWPDIESTPMRMMSALYVPDSHVALIVPAGTCTNAVLAAPNPYQGYRGRAPLPLAPAALVDESAWHDRTFDELVTAAAASGIAPSDDVSLLVLGCRDPDLMLRASNETGWRLAGAGSENAASTMPLRERFDVVWLDRPLSEFEDPLAAVMSIRLLVAAGGRLIVSAPNLDSAQIDLFGPTWWGWDPAHSRITLSLRGLNMLAQRAGMRLRAHRSYSHPERTARSLMQRDRGLGVASDSPSEEIRSQALAIYNWSRSNADPHGKGDRLVVTFERRS